MAEGSVGYFGQVRAQFMRRRSHRACTVIILGTIVIAVLADLLASDLPLAVSFRGQTHVLPNVFRPAALRGYDNQRLLDAMTPEDWAVFPPVPWGYNTHD